jgi:phosphate transport system permease protein
VTTATELASAPPRPDEDVPLDLDRAAHGADRAFQIMLATAAAIVLAVLVAVVVFLAVDGWSGLQHAGTKLVTGSTWAPELGRFDMLPLLVGSIGIALVALIIALPISLATALMINEYLHPRLRPFLTGVVDLLATVPSIVYGFWGLELVSGLQAPPAKWLADHVSFVPFFRTPEPGAFGNSVFACGLVCAVTIIPIITSVSRDVMSQAPRDVCEAAMGLGGTRWGMVTDVVLPFSRNGIVSAALLGLGRGLGETMIVVLMLSQANKLTLAILGPQGLGSIAKQITQDFHTGSALEKSALVLLGLILFISTLLVNAISRSIVNRSARGRA